MTREELMALDENGLKARMKVVAEIAKEKSGKELTALVEEAETINGLMEDMKNKRRMEEMAAEKSGEGQPGEEGNAETMDKRAETRGKELKAGQGVKYKAKRTFRVKAALSSSQTAMQQHAASDVKGTFNNVSSLVDAVKIVPLAGGESYKRGFVKNYGDGAGYTSEGTDYSSTEPVFGYAEIKKEKITAYTEEPEEMLKLPNADYDSVVEESVTRAIRRFCAKQIMIGDGTSGHFKGIFYKPTSAGDDIIDRETDIQMETITDATLDDIIYSFGGEEEVESVATLILNKKDLKAMAKLRDKQGRKIYTIVNRGNTGTIDGVPYLINSACKAVSDAKTSTDDYCMAYGPLGNYEMAVFSDIDARKSTDYKFKQGQIAYRADFYAGGNVAAYNGFIRVYRPKNA